MIPRQPSVPTTEFVTPVESGPNRPKRGETRRRREKNAARSTAGRRLLLEGLEQRQLMAANPIGSAGTIPAAIAACHVPRNIGTVTAAQVNEVERVSTPGLNDTFQTAQPLNLGNLAGQQNTIDVRGTVSFTPGPGIGFRVDQDVYRVDLRAGDILDIGTTGAATSFAVLLGENLNLTDEFGRQLRPGAIWFSRETPNGGYGGCSPLMDGEPSFIRQNTPLNANFAQVIPQTGTYYIRVTAQDTSTNYTLGLRTYRPVSESLAVGQRQIVYLDFDGGSVARDEFNFVIAETPGVPVGGVFNVPSLVGQLTDLNFQVANPAVFDSFYTEVTTLVTEHFAEIGRRGINGAINSPVGGSYGIDIRTSEDRDPITGLLLPEPTGPLVTRVVFGSNVTFPEFGGGLGGIAQNVDVGNFRLDDTVLAFVDVLSGIGTDTPISQSVSLLSAAARAVAGVTSHEIAHALGIYHTDNVNTIPTINDAGGSPNVASLSILGTGPDGIIGTADDVPPAFRTDRFIPIEGTFGTNFVAQSLAHSVVSGRLGSSFAGRVFRDANGDGNGTGDSGLAGVTVFMDLNGNGRLDTTDLQTVSDSLGNFSFSAPPASFNVFAVAPTNFRASTPSSVFVTPGNAGIAFGFAQSNPDVTGFKFEDTNANGFRDPGEPGIAGAFIYADLDGDDQPDIGEPSAVTAADGSYRLTLPILNRAYAIREVATAGFELTVPLSGEHLITFTGAPLLQSLDFGGRASRDWGDAPDSYLTSRAAGGPNHGLRAGLSIGATVSREDDALTPLNGLSDSDDGVVIAQDITASGGGSFQITLTNTTGQSGFLAAWIDLNRNGTFEASEKFVNDRQLGAGTFSLPVPAGGVLGDTFARFRYSLTPGLTPSGPAAAGEVEDYPVRILADRNVANPDTAAIPRNSQAFPIDVLANDRDTLSNPLTITSAVVVSPTAENTRGILTIGTSPMTGRQQLLYTPANGYVGPVEIRYNVVSASGDTGSATVQVNVTFQTAAPIALDDIINIPSNASAVPINVLANDISSQAGGLRVISVTPGSAGGRVNVIEGSQSVAYTPANGFSDAEQFRYTIQDSAGQISTAQVTVILTPQAVNNDQVAYSVRILDLVGNERGTVQQGEDFFVEVSVDDLRVLASTTPQGIASAFVDLIYTSDLVRTVDTLPGDNLPFDLTFGPRFQNTPLEAYRNGDPAPGILNEIGSTVPLPRLQTVGTANDTASHVGPAVLFRIRMRAVGTGLALFQTDPADATASETLLIDAGNLGQQPIPFNRQTFGSVTLPIAPAGANFPGAIDDFFTVPFLASPQTTQFNVLRNDLVPAGTTILEFNVDQAAPNGTVTVNRNGTPNNFADDFIEYRPNPGQQGLDSFSYVLTVNSPTFGTVTSIARVDVTTGAVPNPLVRYQLSYVNEAGQPITTIRSGELFGVRINAIDLRDRDAIDPAFPGETQKTAFQGVLDLLYDARLIQPTNSKFPADKFNFDVRFADQFNQDAAVGVATRAGIIDELGSLLVDQSLADRQSNELATVFFRAIGTGPLSVTASPADRFPESDTLRVNQNQPVPPNQIIYESAPAISISGAASGEPLHNFLNPADVNGDNVVTALDALIVINSLSQSTPSGEPSASGFGSVFFHDVNGDGLVSAVDALRVINFLNGIGGSGEPIAASSPVTGAANNTRIAGESIASGSTGIVFADADASPLTAISLASSVASSAALLPGDSATDSDDETDWLSVLADDVSVRWNEGV